MIINTHGGEDLTRFEKRYKELLAQGMSEDNAFTEAYAEDCNKDDDSN